MKLVIHIPLETERPPLCTSVHSVHRHHFAPSTPPRFILGMSLYHVITSLFMSFHPLWIIITTSHNLACRNSFCDVPSPLCIWHVLQTWKEYVSWTCKNAMSDYYMSQLCLTSISTGSLEHSKTGRFAKCVVYTLNSLKRMGATQKSNVNYFEWLLLI